MPWENNDKEKRYAFLFFYVLIDKIRLSTIAFFLGLWYNIIGDANELYKYS